MAARCTTPAAAMHHFGGMGAPWCRCRTSGGGVCFARSGGRSTNGKGAVLARRTQFRIVLRHERQHIVSGDSWVKLFYMVLAAALWWNPVVHIFREKLDDILEYRCDQAVLKGSSETERIIYTETLLTVARQAAAFPGQRKRLGAVGFLSSHPENTLITRTNLRQYRTEK